RRKIALVRHGPPSTDSRWTAGDYNVAISLPAALAWLLAGLPSSRAATYPRSGLNQGYRDRVLAALGWSVSGEFAVQVTRAALGVALARLLNPEDFGLVAMLFIGVNFLILIVDFGFQEALVQRRDISEAHRSSVFWIVLLWGLLLSGAL